MKTTMKALSAVYAYTVNNSAYNPIINFNAVSIANSVSVSVKTQDVKPLKSNKKIITILKIYFPTTYSFVCEIAKNRGVDPIFVNCIGDKKETLRFVKILKNELCKKDKTFFENNIHFTEGDEKLSGIGSIGLSPWLTCIGLPCFNDGNGICYGLKGNYLFISKLYYNALNTVYLSLYPESFAISVINYLHRNPQLKKFRWFETGDFMKKEDVMIFDFIAERVNDVEFLAMSKKDKIVESYLQMKPDHKTSKNFIIRLSNDGLDGFKIANKFALPVTDIVESHATPVCGHYMCEGSKARCADCCNGKSACWDAKINHVDFRKH